LTYAAIQTYIKSYFQDIVRKNICLTILFTY